MIKRLIGLIAPKREKKSPEFALKVIPRDQHNISRKSINPNALKVLYRLNSAGFEAYLVGGGVRDLLLGVVPKDFDIATSAHPEQVRDLFQNARLIGRRFRLAHVRFGRDIIEVATFRRGHGEDDDEDADAIKSDKGLILRDNVYGNKEEDALRRDFTINALYYGVQDFSIHDYAGGLEDLRLRQVRLIGDPETRYREDPVRMLRAIRFAAKLGFDLPPETATPIHRLAPMLGDIPAARLYEEVLKVFLNGSAEDSFDLLQQYNLFAPLFPLSAAELEQDPEYCTSLVRLALRNTDVRLAEGKTVTPAFLFAALLWPGLLPLIARCQAEGLAPVPAIQKAAHMLLPVQIQRIAIPRRFTMPMQEIWALQERLPYRYGKRAETVLAHPRFRAAYDFLLLREDAGEDTGNLGQWWTDYQFASEPDRRRMITELSGPVRKSRRPRKRKARTTGPAGSNH